MRYFDANTNYMGIDTSEEPDHSVVYVHTDMDTSEEPDHSVAARKRKKLIYKTRAALMPDNNLFEL